MDTQQTRDSDIYFPDGDIVLSAASPSDNGSLRVFRVHRVFLANASEVFADMFTVVSTEHANAAAETYDGVPLVHMSGDDADAVKMMLRTLYKASELYSLLSKTPASDVPVVVAPLLRLAKKYMVQDLEKVIIDHIKSGWPTSLEGWTKYASSTAREPAAALLFAIEHDVPEMLPAAFYQLTTSEVTDWPYEEPDWALWLGYGDTAPQARWRTLAQSGHMVAFLQARNRLDVAIRKSMQAFLTPPKGQLQCKPAGFGNVSPQCLADLRQMCTDELLQNYLFSEEYGVLDHIAILEDLLEAQRERRQTTDSNERACDGCWLAFGVHVYVTQMRIWQDICDISQSFIARGR